MAFEHFQKIPWKFSKITNINKTIIPKIRVINLKLNLLNFKLYLLEVRSNINQFWYLLNLGLTQKLGENKRKYRKPKNNDPEVRILY